MSLGIVVLTMESYGTKGCLKALQRDHAAELKLAAERLKGTARHTEIIPSPVLSEMTGHEILLKPENLHGYRILQDPRCL